MSERATVITKAPETKRENKASQTSKPELSQSTSSPIDQILFLQRTIGNQAVQRLFKSGMIQAKLKIGEPNDIYEQEADRVADQVMRMNDEEVRTSQAPPSGQRLCSECDEELRAKPANGSPNPATAVPPMVHYVLRSPGQPLDTETRAFFEPRFGRGFGDVSVHADERAAESARGLQALAYTVGRDIVFSGNAYAPGTNEGQRLLAHELAHVVQQAGDRFSLDKRLSRQNLDDVLESTDSSEGDYGSSSTEEDYGSENGPMEEDGSAYDALSELQGQTVEVPVELPPIPATEIPFDNVYQAPGYGDFPEQIEEPGVVMAKPISGILQREDEDVKTGVDIGVGIRGTMSVTTVCRNLTLLKFRDLLGQGNSLHIGYEPYATAEPDPEALKFGIAIINQHLRLHSGSVVDQAQFFLGPTVTSIGGYGAEIGLQLRILQSHIFSEINLSGTTSVTYTPPYTAPNGEEKPGQWKTEPNFQLGIGFTF